MLNIASMSPTVLISTLFATLPLLLLLLAAPHPTLAKSVANDVQKGITPDMIPPTLGSFEEVFVPVRNWATLRVQKRVPVQMEEVERVIIQMTGHE